MGNRKSKDGRQLCTLAEASRMAGEYSLAHGDWSGVPIPVFGLKLVVEPRYRRQDVTEFQWKEYFDENGVGHVLEQKPKEPQKPSEFQIVNSWWNEKYQVRIAVVRNKQGRAQHRVWLEDNDRLSFTLRTLEAACVWPVEAERKAMKKLASLIPKDVFELYALTGHFLEVSKRSGLTYLFRKGRPTVAMREMEEGIRPLCALCLHPIGYYGDTWAGVMCPSDEVIAHLLMMRGSEEKYWANANQHQIDRPAAGI